MEEYALPTISQPGVDNEPPSKIVLVTDTTPDIDHTVEITNLVVIDQPTVTIRNCNTNPT